MSEREGTKVSLNELARRAGLAPGVMSRLSQDTGRMRRSPETLTKLADAHRVSLEWLVAGRGQPELPDEKPADRYPHRTEAARIARDGGIDEEAIRSILEEDVAFDRDPSILWWLHEIERRALWMRGGVPLREPAHTPVSLSQVRPVVAPEPDEPSSAGGAKRK